MRHHVIASALLAILAAACGGDGKITEPQAASQIRALAAIGTDPKTGATIETDLDDYPPGFAVNLRGRGWAPNEVVHLTMSENPDTHADVSQDVQADSLGAFALHFYDVQETDLGVTFTLTATGQASGSVATAMFTDGNLQLQPNPTPNPFSPNGDGQADALTITARNQGNGDITDIFVSIRPQGAAVSGTALRVITVGTLKKDEEKVSSWDGRNTSSVLQPDGVYSIRIYSTTDPAQDEASANGQRLFNVTLDNTAPVVTNVVATPNAANAGAATAVTVTAVATDARSSISGAKLTIDGGSALTMTAVDGNFNQLSENLTFAIPGATVAGLAAGPHQLCVVATDVAANTTTPAVCTTLTINNPNSPPTVSAGGPYVGNEGGSGIAIVGTATDADGSVASVAWSVVSVVPAAVTCSFGDATQLSTTVTCNDNAAVTIKLTATDDDGANNTATANVTVNNVAPTATFNAPASVSGGSPIAISLTNPTDPSTVDVNAGFTYAFDCGDGAGYNAFSATTTRSCPTGGTGSRAVKGKIKDKDNEETEYSASVAVNNVAPTSTTTGGPYSGNEGSAINISGSGSDPDGGTVTYLWSVAPNDGICTFNDATSASTTVTCKDNGSWNLTLTVTDDETASTPSAATGLTVANVKPTAIFNAPSSVNEGSTINLSLTSPVEPSVVDAAALQYSFDCGTGAGYVVAAGSSVACPTTDNGSRTVKGKIADKDGGYTEYTASVTINNVDPTATFVAPASVNEGSAIALSLTSPVDPSSADFEAGFKYFFDCGLGAGYVVSVNNSASCPTTDNGTRAVKGKIEDKDGGSTVYTASVAINNVAPTATLIAPASVNEGSPIAVSLNGGTDVSSVDLAAGFTYAFDCGTGYGGFGPSNSVSCPTNDNGNRTVKGKIRDKDNGEREYTGSVAVANVDPILSAITIAPGALVSVNTKISASAPFTDVGTGDIHTGTYAWDDGTTSSATVSETNGSGSASDTHTYTAAGVYLVKLTLNDDDGGTASTEYRYVVVYDPNAGFVTGGGWIMSEASACPSACGGATGRANFGFVAKYKKGATVPEGDTEFQFQAGNLNFKSAAYEWLVVSGARGQFKGTGTINGSAGYAFLLTAVDGQISGGGNIDKFRIKIWNKTTGVVIYDNQPTADDDNLDAGTVISGGSIVIHSK